MKRIELTTKEARLICSFLIIADSKKYGKEQLMFETKESKIKDISGLEDKIKTLQKDPDLSNIKVTVCRKEQKKSKSGNNDTFITYRDIIL